MTDHAMAARQEAARLYSLLATQVKSYHKHYHMGDNTSVPTEVAEELYHSIVYTLNAAAGGSLSQGQQMLLQRTETAKQQYRLVSGTAPEFQNETRWDALAALDQYLQRYDHLHFAHRIPDVDYPLLISPPSQLQGIDYALFYLNCLWMENQLLHGFSAADLEMLYSCAPPGYWDAPQNLCEQPLWNALALTVLGDPLSPLLLSQEQLRRLAAKQEFPACLEGAVQTLAAQLQVLDWSYIRGAASELLPRLQAAQQSGNLSNLFFSR